MADGEVEVKVGADTGEFEREVQGLPGKAERALGKASGSKAGAKVGSEFAAAAREKVSAGAVMLGSVLAQALTGALSGVGELVGAGIGNSDALLKFEQTMGFAGFDDARISAAEARLKEYADRTVYELRTVMNMAAQLGANGVGAFDELSEAAGNLNAVAGGNRETMKSFAQVMTQTASAGKLTWENWRQLTEAVPGVAGRLRDALSDMGAYTGDFQEAMSAGQITAEEFNAAVLAIGSEPVAVEAAKSVKTFEGAVGNARASVVNGFQRMYEAANKNGRMTDAIVRIGDAFGGLLEQAAPAFEAVVDGAAAVAEALAGMDPGARRAALAAAGVAASLAPLSKGAASLAPALLKASQAMAGVDGAAAKAASGMARASTAVAGLTRASGLLKAGAVGLAAALAADMLGRHISQVQQAAEQQRRLTQLSGGLSGALAELGGADLSGLADGMAGAARGAEDLVARSRETTQAVLELHSSVAEGQREVASGYAEASRALEVIEELTSKQSLNGVEQERLRQAVEDYNSVTGESVEVIDAASGSIDANTSSMRENMEAWKRSAEVQSLVGAWGQYSAQLAELEAQTDGLRSQFDEAVAALADLGVAYDEVRDKDVFVLGLTQGDVGAAQALCEQAAALEAELDANARAIEGVRASMAEVDSQLDSYADGTDAARTATGRLTQAQQQAANAVSGAMNTLAAGGELSERQMARLVEAFGAAGADASALSTSFLSLAAEAGLTGEAVVRAALGLGEYGRAAGEAAGASGDAGRAAEGAGALARGSGASWEELSVAMGAASGTAEGAGAAVEEALAAFSGEAGKLPALTREVNAAVGACLPEFRGFTDAEVALALASGLAGDSMVALARDIAAAEGALDGAAGAAGGAVRAVPQVTLTWEETAAAMDAAAGSSDALSDAQYRIGAALSHARVSGADLADTAGEINAALRDAAVSADGLTEAQVLQAVQGKASAEQLMAYAAAQQARADAEEEAAEAARRASEEEAARIEALRGGMEEFAAAHLGMREAVEASGRSLDEFVLGLDASGIGLDSFKASFESLSSMVNPLERFAGETETYTWQMRDNLLANAEAVRSYSSNVAEMYSRATTEQELAFADYVASLGPAQAQFLEYLMWDADVSFQELALLYADGEMAATEGAIQVADAQGEAAGRVYGESLGEGVSEGGDMEAAAERAVGELSGGLAGGVGEVSGSAGLLGDGTMQALMDLPSEMRARGNAAGGHLALGFGDASPMVSSAVGELAQAAAEQVPAMLGGMAEAGRAAGEAFAEAVPDGAAGAVEGLALALAPSVSGVAPAMAQAGRAAGEAFADGLSGADCAGACAALSQGCARALSGMAAAMGSVGAEAGGSLAAGLGGAGPSTETAASRHVAACARALASFEGDMGALGTGAGRALASGIGGTNSSTELASSRHVEAAARALAGFAASTGQVGGAAGQSLADGLSSKVAAAYWAAHEVGSAALSSLSSFSAHAYASGGEMGRNFASGLRTAVGSIASAAAEAAGAASSYLHFTEPEKGPLVGINDSGGEMVRNYAASMLSELRTMERASDAVARAALFGEGLPAPRSGAALARAAAGAAAAAAGSAPATYSIGRVEVRAADVAEAQSVADFFEDVLRKVPAYGC